MKRFITFTKKSSFFCLVLLHAAMVIAQPAAVTLPSSSPYLQDFNAIPGPGGGTYPAGWGGNNKGAFDPSMAVGNSGSTTGDNYNYGSNIGILGSGSNYDPAYLILAIANTSGKTNIKISYDVIKIREQTRDCTFDLQISTSSPSAGFVSVAGGAYNSGSLGQGTVSRYLNLNLSGLDNKGAPVYLRWYYVSSGSGSRDAVALDNVSITWNSGASVENLSATAIEETTARFNANVTSDGNSSILEKGFLWGTTSGFDYNTPGVNKLSMTSNLSLGTYDTSVQQLPPGTRIYYRAFVRTVAQTGHSTEGSFYTKSRSPLSFPGTFTATALSKNSIRLDWSQVDTSLGYLIFQSQVQAPVATPVDANSYLLNSRLGNDTLIAIATPGNQLTTTVNGLFQGTRYYYSIVPFNWNGANPQTYNYYTDSIRIASDSTFGAPASFFSDMTILPLSGDTVISSLENTLPLSDSTKGVRAFKIRLRDGGASGDADDLPTALRSLRLVPAVANTVTNWSAAIQAIVLIDDSTGAMLASGVIGTNTITFSGLNVIAADNNYRSLTVRLSLRKGGLIDNQRFAFRVRNTEVTSDQKMISSQFSVFDTSSSYLRIRVAGTSLRFSAQPSSVVEAGAFMSQVRLQAIDTFSNVDVDFNDRVVLYSSAGNLYHAPRTDTANGEAIFDTLKFSFATPYDTLIAFIPGSDTVRSNVFRVENSKLTDIVASLNFSYPQNIDFVPYTDTNSVTLTNSLPVATFVIREGGVTGDLDSAATTVTSMQVNASAGVINRLGLYLGNTKIADTLVNTGVVGQFRFFFPNLSLFVADNDSLALTLRATFKSLQTDKTNFALSVVSATTDAAGSSLRVTTPFSAAVSSIAGNNNRLDVIVKNLKYTVQPQDVAAGNIQYPEVKLVTLDTAGNLDIDPWQVQLSVNNNVFSNLSIAQRSSNAGTVVFSRLAYTNVATDVWLTATIAGIPPLASDSFDVLQPVWFRSIQNGYWMDTATWEISHDNGNTWLPAGIVPDYQKHGSITVRSGHTVTMNGTLTAQNTVDETLVEKNATLVTPVAAGQLLRVNDAAGNDLVVEGTLLQTAHVVAPVAFTTNAGIQVKKDGVIELSGNGLANEWAANPNIYFDSGAVYVHNTAASGSIKPGIFFPNADSSTIPVFRFKTSVTYPSANFNAAATVTINGLLLTDTLTVLNLAHTGSFLVRNGLWNNGILRLSAAGNTILSGNGRIGGSGMIQSTSAGSLRIGQKATVLLANDKLFNGPADFVVEGTMDYADRTFSGNASYNIAGNGVVISAHTNGFDGSVTLTGNRNYSNAATYIFDGAAAQNAGTTGAVAHALKVVNNNALTLSNAIKVTGELDINATVKTTDVALLSLDTAVTVTRGSNFIDGPLGRFTADSALVEFFTGDSLYYGPVQLVAKGAGYRMYTAAYSAVHPQNSGYDTALRANFLERIVSGDYWAIANPSNHTGEVSLGIPYTSFSGISAVNTTDIRIARWNNSLWADNGPLRTAGTAEVWSDVLPAFGVFTLAKDSSCNLVGAPVLAPVAVCEGNVLQLTYPVSNNVRWYAQATDSIPVAIGSTAAFGVIYYDSVFYVEESKYACVSPRGAVQVTVKAIPVIPVVSAPTLVCYDAAAQLSASSGADTRWLNFSDSSLLGSGSTFMLSNLLTDTAVLVQAEVNGCVSDIVRQTLRINAPVTVPVATGSTVCAGAPAILRASANTSIVWKSGAGQPILQRGNVYTTTALQTDTAFYAIAVDANNCESPATQVKVLVKPLPAAPLINPVNAICEGIAVQLSATGQGNIHWYNDTVSTIPVFSGNVYQTPLLYNTRLVYAGAELNGCSSVVKTPVRVEVIPYPALVMINVPATGRAGQQVTITASNASAANYTWNFGAGATPATATGPGPHQVSWATKGSKAIQLTYNNGATTTCGFQAQAAIALIEGVGIEETTTTVVQLYPNPATGGWVNIATTVTPAFVTLTDAIGRTINTSVTIENDQLSVLDVRGVKPGMYIVRVEQAGRTYHGTLVIK